MVRKIRWFRVYDDFVDDPKVQRLSGELIKALINLWCLTSQNDGLLPAAEHISFKLRISPEKVRKIIADLSAAGLIDEDDGALRPHNWNGRQFKADVSTPRVKRFRKRNETVSSTVSETPPDTDTDSEAKTDPEKRKKEAARAAPELKLVEPAPTPSAEYYRFAERVCGPKSGGLAKLLLSGNGGNLAYARAALERASQAGNPRDYLHGILRNLHQPPGGEQYIDPRLG